MIDYETNKKAFFENARKERRAAWDKVWKDGIKKGEDITLTRQKAHLVWKEFFEKNDYRWA